MDYKYSYQDYKEDRMARALGRGLPISVKHSIEVSNKLRGMNVIKAKKFLENVIEMKQPVSYTRFNKDLGHKKKMGPGRYPVKTAQNILKVLKLAEANALFKGLSVNDLKIAHIVAQKAEGRWRYGRQRRRKFKTCHIEIVLEEAITKEKKKTEPKKEEKAVTPAPVKPEGVAAAEKPAVRKEETIPEIKKEQMKPEVKIAKTETSVKEKQEEMPKATAEEYKKKEPKENKKKPGQAVDKTSQSTETKKEELKND